MFFKPVSQRSRWEGLVLLIWIFLLDVLLLIWAQRRALDSLKFLLILLVLLSLPVAGQILYRTWIAFSLKYKLDRDALTIYWANKMQIIPLQSVRRVFDHGVEDQGRSSLSHWPAPQVRLSQANNLPPIWILATQSLMRCMILDTGDTAFAISPAHKADFLTAIQEYYRMGPVHNRQLVRVHTGYWHRFAEVGRPGAMLIGMGLLGVVLLWTIFMMNYPNLSEGVATARSTALLLPYIGLMTWLVNGAWGAWMAWRQQPTGAYLLWGGAVIVQICTLFALNSILP